MIKEKEPQFIDFQENPEIIPLEEEACYNLYLKELDLDPEDIKGKAILDIGCGSNPIFVNYCLTNGVTKNIYGVDDWQFLKEFDWYSREDKEIYLKEQLNQSKGKRYYIQSKAETLPIKPESLDLIIMRAATTPEMEFDKLFKQISIVLKHGGEFRMYPVQKEIEYDDQNKAYYTEREKIEKTLSSLKPEEFEFIWKEKKAYEADNKEYYKDLLIIRKK